MKETFDIDYALENRSISSRDINIMKEYFKHEYMHMNEEFLTAAAEHFVQTTYQIPKLQDGNIDLYEVSYIADYFINEVKKLFTNDYMYYSVYATDIYHNNYEIRIPYDYNGSLIDPFLDLHVGSVTL